MSRFLLLFSSLLLSGLMNPIVSKETLRHYLSGVDKDSEIYWDFKCSSGRNSGEWSKIKVPSCWETQGFGTYYYGWEEPKDSDETGYYRYRFTADKSWTGSDVRLVFEGSMTDTEVRINGRNAGDIHSGGFYRFGYDVTGLLAYGKENTLEVKVRKCPSDTSVYSAERQTDFWLFGGIYRPVYLEISPADHIESLAVDARADGSLAVRPYVAGGKKSSVSVHVETLSGERVSETIAGNPGDTLRMRVSGITPWSHETPVLYRLVAELKSGDMIVHRTEEKIGFRTFEFRPADGFYLNGQRVIFKGVNRHCFWPESGRTLSREISLADALLIKEMNMNSVRMSHYPPDKEFLEICDSVGLLVIDELCGWQKKYDTPVASRLVRSVVERDRNHPSVIMWANGNEGGWNRDVDGDYEKYDLQHRFVIHPWERFAGTDTKHYPDYNYVVNSTLYDSDIYFPTEFMHSIFDGGGGASLADFWDMMMKHRAPAGGFIWALIDEGLVRADMNDSIDCRRDLAPDGILGSRREKEGSFYAVREIWSPVRVSGFAVASDSAVRFRVENDYMFTNLADCRFTYSLEDISLDSDGHFAQRKVLENQFAVTDCAPGERRVVDLKLPVSLNGHDLLKIRVTDPNGHEVITFSHPLSRENLQQRLKTAFKPAPVEIAEDGSRITVTQGGNSYIFSKADGRLESVSRPCGTLSLGGYPAVATSENRFKDIAYYRDDENYIVEPQFDGPQWIRWIFSPDEAPRVDYSFSVDGETDYIGIGFDYPEEKIISMEWVGDGPYRVWKNRREGVTFGVHSKNYNNTVTGQSWNYPEFKGYHSDCRAVTVKTSEGDFTLLPSRPDMFLQMFNPSRAEFGNDFTAPPGPGSSIGFMYAIPPIGTKFQSPTKLGPSGQKNMQLNYTPFSGSIYLLL